MTAHCKMENISLEVAGKSRNKYLCRVPVDHSIEEVRSPEYFGKVMASDMLTVGDIIEIEWQDYSRFGELQVMAQSLSTSQCVTRERIALTDYTPQTFPKGWSSKWLGGAEHHGLFYNGEPVEKETGFLSTEAASIRAHAIAATRTAAENTRAAVKAAIAPKPTKAKKADAEAESEAA